MRPLLTTQAPWFSGLQGGSCAGAERHFRRADPTFQRLEPDGWTVKITGYELGDHYGNTFRLESGLLLND